MKVWVDGRLGDADTARVSPFDHGLLVGDGVFETLRVYGGAPFAWTRHTMRLASSAAGLGLAVPESAVLRSAAEAVLSANGLSDARLRITVTGGISPLGSTRGDAPPTVVVAAAACRPPTATVPVAMSPWPRNEHGATAGLKTISYAENVRALAHAASHGADEAIFANTAGALCEGTGANVFTVRDGVVRTPPAASGCLLGVTRALVLELSAAAGIPAEETTLQVTDLVRADEAFLTGTTREVQGISALDGETIPAPGPITRRLATAFTDLVDRDADP